MKTCKGCGEEKLESEYWKHRETIDGLRSKCKACYTEQVKSWVSRNREKCNAYSVAWQKRNPETTRRIAQENYARHRERYNAEHRTYRAANREYFIEYDRRRRSSVKVQAREQLKLAVRRGDIVKPAHCARCESTDRIEGHHPDYAKPFDVLWLCKPCHAREHRKYSSDSQQATQ